MIIGLQGLLGCLDLGVARNWGLFSSQGDCPQQGHHLQGLAFFVDSEMRLADSWGFRAHSLISLTTLIMCQTLCQVLGIQCEQDRQGLPSWILESSREAAKQSHK